MSKASRGRETGKDVGKEGSSDQLIEEIESFREQLIQFLRAEESSIESGLSNSNSFNSIRVFSRLPAENGKPAQILAASVLLGGDEVERKVKNQVGPKLTERIEKYISTLASNKNRYFPDGDASYYSSSDKIVFHNLPKEFLDKCEFFDKVLEVLEPFLEHFFSDLTDKKDLKDALAHEGTHSWLTKNSKKPDLKPTEELNAAQECFCFLSGWAQSGIYLEENHLIESKTPQKEKVAWGTQLMIEKAKKEDLGVDWARENAKKMYQEASLGNNPFLFIFKQSLMDYEKQSIERYKKVIENSLQEVFEEFSEMVKDVEKASLNQGQKISYEKAKQIESQTNWGEPEKAEQRLKKAVFQECIQNLYTHDNIDSVIHREVENEAQKLGEYVKMVSKLEESLDSNQLVEEAEQVKKDLNRARQQIAASD